MIKKIKQFKNKFFFIAILATTVTIGIYNFLKIKNTIFIFSDSLSYIGNAISLSSGKEYIDTAFPPFYSMILAILYKLTDLNNIFFYTHLLHLFLYIIMILVIYVFFITYNIPQKAAFWSILLLSLNNLNTIFTLNPQSECLYMILTFLTFILVEKYFKSANNIYLISCVISCGLAFYTRAHGILLCSALFYTIFKTHRFRWQTFFSLLAFFTFFSFIFYLWLFQGITQRYITKTIVSADVSIKWYISELFFHVPVKIIFGYNFYTGKEVNTFFYPILKLVGTTKLSIAGILSIISWTLLFIFFIFNKSKNHLILKVYIILSLLLFVIYRCKARCAEPRYLLTLLPLFLVSTGWFFISKKYNLAFVLFCIFYVLVNIQGYLTYYKSEPSLNNIYEIHKNTNKCLIDKNLKTVNNYTYFKLCYNKHPEIISIDEGIINNFPNLNLLILTNGKKNIPNFNMINCYSYINYIDFLPYTICLYRVQNTKSAK